MPLFILFFSTPSFSFVLEINKKKKSPQKFQQLFVATQNNISQTLVYIYIIFAIMLTVFVVVRDEIKKDATRNEDIINLIKFTLRFFSITPNT